jgi:UDP-glucose 4-epimerase
MKILVTGGAGFIGSYLVDRLIAEGNEVIVLDNMSAGRYKNEKAVFVKADLLDKLDLPKVDEIWHLAANPEVRVGDPDIHEKQNVLATKNILEWMNKNNVKKIYFTSTSTVYGDAQTPTPEEYELKPISSYGKSKMQAEQAIINSGMKYVIFRFANVVGARSGHGVIFDFVQKLKNNPNELEILGDGKQNKSYIHINDCIDAMIFSRKLENEIVNVGTDSQTNVDNIAEIISKEMGLTPKLSYTGGERGWKGDVPKMLLSINKIKIFGWIPNLSSNEAITQTVRGMLGK